MQEQSALTLWQWLEGIPALHWMLSHAAGQALLGLLVLLPASGLLGWIITRILRAVLVRMLAAVNLGHWSSTLRQHGVMRNLGYALPLLIVMSHFDVLPIEGVVPLALSRLFLLLGLFFLFRALGGVLSTWAALDAQAARAEQTRSVKGYIELVRILAWAIFLVLTISILINRSPLLLLSGLGALSAVLMLVFKDTLLSFVASAQMTRNDMLRVGDWIEMPQAGADGSVIDMALHTVKVQNWDNTVTTIPTYRLVSESYRNWRHMFETGGRKIQRRLRIDANSVRFLDDADIAALSRYTLLHDYLEQKRQEVEQTNRQLGEAAAIAANRRRLTNIGTFRAYALAYLKSLNTIHQGMTLIVRMMQPDAQGIPIEIYAFTNTTGWVAYEGIQGDIFDHLLAILPEMGLRLYQSPSGADVAQIGMR